ncbi:hypothetical protein Goari_018074 [Gossypium aridum]|uniref:DUF4283 domain-containing protein n=1 Tax=Gossypium aridum TaxID=34290 RepID=A0A7J8WNM2_GOSAI|nr:hypothetical protein [Gossypium aridum]
MGSKLDSRKENNMEKGFDLKDGDVITEVVDEILSITFSDRVHQFIEWKIQLMDLENEFYLVQFDDIDDYNNVLTGGPWVVYGNYLTVGPWSPNFSTTRTDVNVQLVWICLTGLHEGFYSEQCVEEEAFGLWMLVEKHRRREGQSFGDATSADQGKELLGKMVGKENSLFYFGASFVARDMLESSSANSVELVE